MPGIGYDMRWIKDRLDDLKKTGDGLAMAMGLRNKQRAYAIWTPDRRTGKTRKVQTHEVPALAAYLELSTEEVMKRLGLPDAYARHGTVISNAEPHGTGHPKPTPDALLFRTARAAGGQGDGFMLYGDGVDANTPKRFSFRVIDDKYDPVYRVRDTLTIDPMYPIIVGEDCVFSADTWPPTGGLCVIARLLRETSAAWLCRPITGGEEFQLARTDFKNAWAIVGRTRPD